MIFTQFCPRNIESTIEPKKPDFCEYAKKQNEKPIETYGGVIDAILSYDEDALRAALCHKPNLANQTDKDGNTPLFYCAVQADIELLAIVCAAGVDFQAPIRDDVMYKVSSIPIYQTGGGTIFHVCAEKGLHEVIEWLIANLDNKLTDELLKKLDYDGHDAGMIAQLNLSNKASLEPTLDALGVPKEDRIDPEDCRKVYKDWRIAQRKRIRDVYYKREQDRVAKIQDTYVPLHKDLFTCDKSLLTKMLEPAILKQDLSQITPICDGVVSLPILTPLGCRLILEEAEHYEKTMNAGMVKRPNSMNNHGVVVTDLGLTPLLFQWLSEAVNPLSHMLYDDEDNEGRGPFESVHAFTIRYKQGEDTDLKEHRDDSDLTVNVCLGSDFFEGALLYFKPKRGSDETVKMQHHVGHGVVHKGNIRHGAEHLTAGVRSNLVIWCRHRPPMPGQGPSKVAPPSDKFHLDDIKVDKCRGDQQE